MSPNFSPVPESKQDWFGTSLFWDWGRSGFTISDLQLLLLLGCLEVEPLHRLLGSFPLNNFTSGCDNREREGRSKSA